MSQVKAICKSVNVRNGGYKEVNERDKVVEGQDRCTVFTFEPVPPPPSGEKNKQPVLNTGFEVVVFGNGSETSYDLDKAYTISITPTED